MDAFLKSGKLGQAKQASEKPASQPEKVNLLNQLITRIGAARVQVVLFLLVTAQ
jgi:hypothetical protein